MTCLSTETQQSESFSQKNPLGFLPTRNKIIELLNVRIERLKFLYVFVLFMLPFFLHDFYSNKYLKYIYLSDMQSWNVVSRSFRKNKTLQGISHQGLDHLQGFIFFHNDQMTVHYPYLLCSDVAQLYRRSIFDRNVSCKNEMRRDWNDFVFITSICLHILLECPSHWR